MIDFRSSRLIRAVAVVGVMTAIASCTLLGSREIRQCNSDQECSVNENASVANPRVACIDHLCSPRLDAGGADVAVEAEAGGPVPCTAGCPTDPPNVCVDGTCTPLLSAACPRLPNSQYRDAYQQDGALLMGVYVFAPLSAGPEVRTIEAAMRDINDQLPPQTRISAVLCEKKGKLYPNGIGSPTNAQDVVDHLASRKVPLVVGQFEASELKDLKTQGLTVWSTLGNSPGVAQGRTEYRFLVDELANLATGYGPALAAAVSRAETVHGTAPPSPTIRMVVSDREESRLLGDAIDNLMLPLLDGGSDYARISPELPSEFESAGPNNGLTQKALVAALPHVIIAIGGDEIATLIKEVERPPPGQDVWPLGTPRPIWVVSTRGKFSANALANVITEPNEPVRERLIGVDFGGNRAHLATLLGALTGVNHAGSYDHLYDAMYAATFAAMRAQANRGKSTGPYGAAELVQGLDEILQGPAIADAIPVDGAFNLRAAVDGIQNKKPVYFTGTTGPWLFPAGSRVSRRNMGISYFCFSPTQSGFSYYVDSAALTSPSLCKQP